MNIDTKNFDKLFADYLSKKKYPILFATMISLFKGNFSFFQYAERKQEETLKKDEVFYYLQDNTDLALATYRYRYLIRSYILVKHAGNWYCDFFRQEQIDTLYEHAYEVIGKIIIDDIADDFFDYVSSV